MLLYPRVKTNVVAYVRSKHLVSLFVYFVFYYPYAAYLTYILDLHVIISFLSDHFEEVRVLLMKETSVYLYASSKWGHL